MRSVRAAMLVNQSEDGAADTCHRLSPELDLSLTSVFDDGTVDVSEIVEIVRWDWRRDLITVQSAILMPALHLTQRKYRVNRGHGLRVGEVTIVPRRSRIWWRTLARLQQQTD